MVFRIPKFMSQREIGIRCDHQRGERHGPCGENVLQHNDANASHSFLIRQVLLVNSSRNRGGAIVVEVEVKLPIASSKFELFEEQRVIVKRKCVEHIKVRLLSQDQSVIHQHQQTLFESLHVIGESCFGCIVVQVSSTHIVMLGILNDGGFEVVEGKEVGDLVRFRVLYHVCPDDLLFHRLRLVHEPMVHFLSRKGLVQRKPRQVSLQKIMHCVNVFGLHGAKTGGRGSTGQVILGDLARLGGSGRERREADLVKLQPVQRTVVVAA